MKRADENSTIAVDFNGRIVSYDLSELDELSLAYTARIQKARARNTRQQFSLWRPAFKVADQT